MEKLFNLSKDQINEVVRQYELLQNNLLRNRENNMDGYPERNEFQRDYARVLYSPSFRRLQGKMQIVGIDSSAFYRNRLTHSLEVAQIATSIASLLAKTCKRQDMYVDDIHLIEAAALAHDIGHPAFGHKGERVLNSVASKYKIHFEGNAQNYRVLRYLEKKDPGKRGLNLTHRTLLAINKYIIEEADNKKKFIYTDDFNYLNSIREQIPGLKSARTLDVQIIELADDIAYAVHDLEDGLSLRNFTIGEILFMLKKKSEDSYQRFNKIVTEILDYSNDANIDNVQDHSKLFRMKLTSKLTNLFVTDITLGTVSPEKARKNGTNENQELTLGKNLSLLDNLKDVIFDCTTRDNSVQLYESRGEIVLRTLYSIYSNVGIDEDGKLMPPDYRPGNKWKNCKDDAQKEEYKKELAQNSIDYIAGMMDTFAIEEYENLTHKKYNEIDIQEMKSLIEKK